MCVGWGGRSWSNSVAMAEVGSRSEQRGSWRAGDDASTLSPILQCWWGPYFFFYCCCQIHRRTDRRFASHHTRIAVSLALLQHVSCRFRRCSRSSTFDDSGFVFVCFFLALFSAVFESASLRIEELMCDHRTHGVVVHLQCSREWVSVCPCAQAQGYGVTGWVSLVIIIAMCEKFGGSGLV